MIGYDMLLGFLKFLGWFVFGGLATLGTLTAYAFLADACGWHEDRVEMHNQKQKEARERLQYWGKVKAVELLLRTGRQCNTHRWPGRIRHD